MSDRSVIHATFTLERTYPASPARVFNAWADPVAKARWFGAPGEWSQGDREQDFCIGGRDRFSSGPQGGPVYTYDARYQDIVPDQRIVYTYDMHRDETRISVSLSTVEFKAEGAGTRLIYTEQGAFLDGHDTPALREQGAGDLFDALGAELQREPANA